MIRIRLSWTEIKDKKGRPECYALWAGSGRSARLVAQIDKTRNGIYWEWQFFLPEELSLKKYWPLENLKLELHRCAEEWFFNVLSDAEVVSQDGSESSVNSEIEGDAL